MADLRTGLVVHPSFTFFVCGWFRHCCVRVLFLVKIPFRSVLRFSHKHVHPTTCSISREPCCKRSSRFAVVGSACWRACCLSLCIRQDTQGSLDTFNTTTRYRCRARFTPLTHARTRERHRTVGCPVVQQRTHKQSAPSRNIAAKFVHRRGHALMNEPHRLGQHGS